MIIAVCGVCGERSFIIECITTHVADIFIMCIGGIGFMIIIIYCAGIFPGSPLINEAIYVRLDTLASDWVLLK
jgi:hypothetical protein